MTITLVEGVKYWVDVYEYSGLWLSDARRVEDDMGENEGMVLYESMGENETEAFNNVVINIRMNDRRGRGIIRDDE